MFSICSVNYQTNYCESFSLSVLLRTETHPGWDTLLVLKWNVKIQRKSDSKHKHPQTFGAHEKKPLQLWGERISRMISFSNSNYYSFKAVLRIQTLLIRIWILLFTLIRIRILLSIWYGSASDCLVRIWILTISKRYCPKNSTGTFYTSYLDFPC